MKQNKKSEASMDKVLTAEESFNAFQERYDRRFQIQKDYDVAKEAYRKDKNETTRKALLKAWKALDDFKKMK